MTLRQEYERDRGLIIPEEDIVVDLVDEFAYYSKCGIVGVIRNTEIFWRNRSTASGPHKTGSDTGIETK